MSNNVIYFLFFIAMIFLVLFVKNSGYIEERINKLYICAIMCNTFAILGYICRTVAEEFELVWLSYLVNVLIYLSGPSIGFFLVLCICKKGEFVHKFIFIVEAVQLIFCVTSPFTKLYFVISDKAVYSRGKYSGISFSVAGIFAAIWIIRMLLRYKEVELKDKMYIILLGMIETFAIILQAFDDRYKLEYFGAAFLLMLFYVFLIESDGKYDKMTGVYSRRYYLSVVSKPINKNNEYAVMFFDANGLKAINDEFGHDAGDTCLVQLADIIKTALDGVAKVFRLGGDEFIAIMNSTDKEYLDSVAERIEMTLEERSCNFDFEISSSIGYAIHSKDELYEDTEKRADKLMYAMKDEYYQRIGKQRR